MAHVLVRLSFEDFERWQAAFTAGASLRKSYGSKGVRVYRVVDKPNEAVVVGEYEDLDRARQMFQSPEFRQATQRAGLLAPPDVTLLDEVFQLPA